MDDTDASSTLQESVQELRDEDGVDAALVANRLQ